MRRGAGGLSGNAGRQVSDPLAPVALPRRFPGLLRPAAFLGLEPIGKQALRSAQAPDPQELLQGEEGKRRLLPRASNNRLRDVGLLAFAQVQPVGPGLLLNVIGA